MTTQPFDFLSQADTVQDLLNACIAALPFLPKDEKEVMIRSMKEFEQYGSPTLWSPNDVDANDEYALTEGEKREAICRFIDGYECQESDWMAIDTHARNVREERQKHIKVEYDKQFSGGDYSGTGCFSYVPLSLIDECAAKDGAGDDGVAEAFTKHTGVSAAHIIHYSMDELYNRMGESIDN